MEPVSAETAAQAAAGVGAGMLIFQIVITLFFIVVFWKVFAKAGQPGWACIIPIYNAIVLLKIAGKPAWWFILMLIPVVNFVIMIITYIGLAKSFGKGGGFAAGLILLGPIFFPILAFGGAKYGAAAPRAEAPGYPG